MAGANAAVDYTSGSLILGFRTNSTTTPIFEFNLGLGETFRDNPAVGYLGNIGTILSDNYGPNWFSSSTLFFGVIGDSSASDPVNTIYVSQRRSSATTQASAPFGVAGTTIGNSLTSFGDLATTFAAQDAEAGTGNKGVLFSQDTAFLNTWQDYATAGASMFGINSGQQVFSNNNNQTIAGITNVEGAVDIFRAVKPDSGNAAWTYETTIVIRGNGDIYAVPEPTTSVLLAGGMAITLFFRRRRHTS